jgi:hypothetical protein
MHARECFGGAVMISVYDSSPVFRVRRQSGRQRSAIVNETEQLWDNAERNCSPLSWKISENQRIRRSLKRTLAAVIQRPNDSNSFDDRMGQIRAGYLFVRELFAPDNFQLPETILSYAETMTKNCSSHSIARTCSRRYGQSDSSFSTAKKPRINIRGSRQEWEGT